MKTALGVTFTIVMGLSPEFTLADNEDQNAGISVMLSDDASLKSNVKSRLLSHRALDASGLTVDVKHGRVSLGGHVSDQASADLAVDIAESTPGVRLVQADLIKTDFRRAGDDYFVSE